MFSLIVGVACGMPSMNIVANVRGKRFEVTGETVQEISKQVESFTGIKASEQSIMYRGKILNPSDNLAEVGLSPGEVVNVVKGRKSRSPTPPSASPITASSPSSSNADSVSGSFDPADLNVDPEKMKEAMAAMDNMLDSNAIEEYFSDEERIEEARQQMLANMDQYERMMPGFKDQASEIASDPQKWKEAMNNAKQQLLKLKDQRDATRSQKSNPNNKQETQNPADTR